MEGGGPAIEGVDSQRDPTPLVHNDIHTQNVMIGPCVANPEDTEHYITPILKLIDFGSGGQDLEGDDGYEDMQSNAIIDNLQNIGYIINALAVLNYELDATTADLVTEPGHPGIRTHAAELLPDSNGNDPCPDLDESLRTMICLCRAVQPSNVPQIGALANMIMEHIQERDEEWYGDEYESDEQIAALFQTLLFDANAS
ncbi:hypothetical protein DL771_000395 [Monosporascus sp. 5C6A]|nr:hypothetical protein DL771_000395 [Monosporascus sp. 5C6A]